jgi:hypothetical protein
MTIRMAIRTRGRPLAAVVLPLAGLLALSTVQAQQGGARFMRDCGAWVEKKGYSVDYIEQRTGERPAGNMAQNWRSNLEPKDVQPGDVVFMYVGDTGGQRAEVVDEVVRGADGTIQSFRTSSMNVGKMVEPVCNITENFGKVVQRSVEFDRVIRAWRPKRP